MTFFSEKGGVGKTSFTIMYASWLRYNHGVKVGVCDFNERLVSYRKTELEKVETINRQIEKGERKGATVVIDTQEAWPILSLSEPERRRIMRMHDDLKGKECAWWLEQALKTKFKDMDVVLLDFPGAISEGSFRQILVRNMIGLTVIPTDNDTQTIASTLQLHSLLSECHERMKGRIAADHCAFINCIRLSNAKTGYEKMARAYEQDGLRVLPDMLSFSEQMKKISEPDIMRSTLRKAVFSESVRTTKDIGTDNLFIDITRELARVPDLEGTGTAALSFVEGLSKTPDDKRQLHGTMFSEYEIPYRYAKD